MEASDAVHPPAADRDRSRVTSRFWLRVAPVDRVPLYEGRAVEIAGREIAIFNLGGRVLAIDNRCPHRGGPLADGIVAGDMVVCPLHGWRVGLATGQAGARGMASCVETYPVRVDDGVIVIGLPIADQASSRAGEVAAPLASGGGPR